MLGNLARTKNSSKNKKDTPAGMSFLKKYRFLNYFFLAVLSWVETK